jgi:hypothetical protein
MKSHIDTVVMLTELMYKELVWFGYKPSVTYDTIAKLNCIDLAERDVLPKLAVSNRYGKEGILCPLFHSLTCAPSLSSSFLTIFLTSSSFVFLFLVLLLKLKFPIALD